MNTLFFTLYSLAHQSPVIDRIIVFFAVLFPYIVILSAGIFLLVHHKIFPSANPIKEFMEKWKAVIFVFFSGALSWLVAEVLKISIQSPRPFIKFTEVHSLMPETGFAFPSQHATFFAAIAVALFFTHKKAGYIFMFFALCIGLARVIAGVHFPIDILAGFVLGALVSIILRRVMYRVAQH